MKYLAVLFILIPTIAFSAAWVDCEKISGCSCKKSCSPDEFESQQIVKLEGKYAGEKVNLYCGIITLDQANELRNKGIRLMKGKVEVKSKDLTNNKICCAKND